MTYRYDCVVVGSGHAGSSAAYAAAQSGCKRVLLIDKCPPEWAGGNGYFTAGAHRAVHDGLADILSLVSNVTRDQVSRIDLEPYAEEQFASDIQRLSDGRSDPNLVDAVVKSSRQAIRWLKIDIGVDFTMSFDRQAYEVNGRQVFWGGMALSVRDGGKGLIKAHTAALERIGVKRMFSTKAIDVIVEKGGVKALKVLKISDDGQDEEAVLTTPSVILAAGGFEASRELRERFLGQGWGRARVRGTPYNTGDGFEIARRAGAKMGERERTNQFTKSGYPLGVMVNAEGERFVDEGEDFRNYTYAKFGRAILMQPHGFAFQIWDSQVISKLRQEEYGDGVVEKIYGDTLQELAASLVERGLETSAQNRLVETIQSFNRAVCAYQEQNTIIRWDPTIKDGKATMGLQLPKSNWALTIDKPPFMAVKVTCGVTFTFGGVGINPTTANVINMKGDEIQGLFATGEMIGGLFYGNYPGGSGLTAGAVFGCKAGQSAAARAVEYAQ
ncbi:Fumarate reductase flavoprotein subunit [Leucoagaricus sp. SymC.cos]|nr:Fumarate reductase flavoprotein subunit [Leucoagaricus sp. SymC.cos]